MILDAVCYIPHSEEGLYEFQLDTEKRAQHVRKNLYERFKDSGYFKSENICVCDLRLYAPPALRREPKEALSEIIDNMIPILEPLGDLTKMSKVFKGRELDTSLVHLVVTFDNKPSQSK